jgi:hypothetical protein
MPSMPPSALIEEVRFARDSPLEGAGFEPSVPWAAVDEDAKYLIRDGWIKLAEWRCDDVV